MMRATIGFGAVLLFLGASGPAHADGFDSLVWYVTLEDTLRCTWLFSDIGETKSTSTPTEEEISDTTTLNCGGNTPEGTSYDMLVMVDETASAVPFNGVITMSDEDGNPKIWNAPGDLGSQQALFYRPSVGATGAFSTIIEWAIISDLAQAAGDYTFEAEITVTPTPP